MKRRFVSTMLAILIIGIAAPSLLYSWSQWGNANLVHNMGLWIDPAGNPQYENDWWGIKTGARAWIEVQPTDFYFYLGAFMANPIPYNDDMNSLKFEQLASLILGTTWLVTNPPAGYRECDVKITINPAPFSWCMGPGYPTYSQIDIASVQAHELGHVLGLGHSTDVSAIMYESIANGQAKRTATADDAAGINWLYPTDGGAMGSTLSGMPGGLELKVNNVGSNAQISFSMPNAATANVKIYDASGRVVQTIVNANLTQGDYVYNWNTSNLNAGVYFVSVETNQGTETAKTVIVK